MLVLKRKAGESIIIDGNIKVTILAIIDGTKVKIGIEAPNNIHIVREEIADQYQEEVNV
jgi:carbon storage regulator